MRARALVSPIVAAAVLAGCSADTSLPFETDSGSSALALNQSSVQVAVGDTVRLRVVRSRFASDQAPAVHWRVTDPSVAGVEDGLVFPLGAGTTTVVASVGGSQVSASLASWGQVKLSGLTITPEAVSLEPGKSQQLDAQLRYSNNLKVKIRTSAAWKTLNGAVAKVDNGSVTAVSTGTTKVIATIAGVSDTVPVVVASVAAPTPEPAPDTSPEPAPDTRRRLRPRTPVPHPPPTAWHRRSLPGTSQLPRSMREHVTMPAVEPHHSGAAGRTCRRPSTLHSRATSSCFRPARRSPAPTCSRRRAAAAGSSSAPAARFPPPARRVDADRRRQQMARIWFRRTPIAPAISDRTRGPPLSPHRPRGHRDGRQHDGWRSGAPRRRVRRPEHARAVPHDLILDRIVRPRHADAELQALHRR